MFMADGKVLQASSNRRLDIKSSLVGEYVYTCKPSNVIGAVAKNCTRTVFTKGFFINKTVIIRNDDEDDDGNNVLFKSFINLY